MEYLKIGKLVAVHGLTGELLLKHELGKRSGLKGLEAIFIEEKKSSFIPWFIQSVRIKNEAEVYLKLEGVDSREQAMKIAHKDAWVPESDFRKLAAKSAPGNLLDYVIIHEKKPLGPVLELIEQPHQLICRLAIDGKEVLIPLNESTLRKIDHARKEVVVELPEGLLDIYLG